ncbi:MAG: hypothetical protein HY809_04910 [Nitrospirae bacterium]|nr:hypothetical protein [Nitrospirota bacterium]
MTGSNNKITEKDVNEIIESLDWLHKSHDCHIDLGEVGDNEVIIYCGAKCAACDTRCLEEAMAEKFPGVKVVYRK